MAVSEDCHRVEHANGVKHDVCFKDRDRFYVRDLGNPDQALSEEMKTASAAMVLDRLGRWPVGDKSRQVVISSRASDAPPAPAKKRH